ncbi:PREDICTED: uncharacterized protein LOC108569309 [Nicrophorus vespilloides]|uniref:Uncharacterized protein LOC108569309 n=1 Tax=Nicrophorus vespilloides TaxID=110193 RepID=A0ABM1NHK5_NICVS|nr:PREDICTED: uncharacterized protein LOC108569309 [Nicrophorus vespilloides]
MHQRAAENRLSIAYTLLVALGATASITAGIAWGHWKDTLANSSIRNASCILYARHTQLHFVGGEIAPCIWVTFGPLIYVLFCVGLACFHGFRVLFGTKGTHTRTITTINEAGETVIMQAVQSEQTSPLPRAYWIVGSVFCCVFTAYSLAHFSIYLDGYLETCKQYRQTLIKLLGVHGTVMPVIHGRLACNAVFDFMDYMQPDTGNAYRDGFINTAADLIIGIVSSTFSWVIFLYAAFVNIKFARMK